MPSDNYSIHIDIKAISNFGKITKNLDAQLAKFEKRVKGVETRTKSASTAFRSLETGMNRLSFIAIPALALGLRSIWNESTRYEAAVKDLSALTGIQGRRLDELTAKADELSVRWGLSAENIVAGMKRIASNKSEFIEIEGAIERVADAAAVLSRASGLSFFKTGETITATMNQFGLGLEDTDRIINTFALGAKIGSFEIDRLSQVFGRAGGMMKGMNLTFEQAMSASMISSRLGLTGEMVGTQLKTALGRLGMVDDAFNPIIDGFDNALMHMQKAGMTPSDLMDVFGLESFQVAQSLLQNVGLFKKWRDELLKGNATAYKQAFKNMEAMRAKMDILVSKFRALQRSFYFDERVFSKIEKAMQFADDMLDQSTWKARLLWQTMKDVAGILAVTFAVTKFVGLIKGVGTIITLFKQMNKIFTVSKATYKLIKTIPLVGKILSLGLTKTLLLVAVVGRAIISLVGVLKDSWGLMTTYWNEGRFEEWGTLLGRSLGFGLVKAFIDILRMLDSIWIGIEKRIHKLVGGKGVSITENALAWHEDLAREKIFAGMSSNESQFLGMKASEIATLQSAIASTAAEHGITQQQIRGGEVHVKIDVDDATGKATYRIEKAENVQVDTGNTAVNPTFSPPLQQSAFGFSGGFKSMPF